MVEAPSIPASWGVDVMPCVFQAPPPLPQRPPAVPQRTRLGPPPPLPPPQRPPAPPLPRSRRPPDRPRRPPRARPAAPPPLSPPPLPPVPRPANSKMSARQGSNVFQRQLQPELVAQLHQQDDGAPLLPPPGEGPGRRGAGRAARAPGAHQGRRGGGRGGGGADGAARWRRQRGGGGRRQRQRPAHQERLHPGVAAGHRALPPRLQHVAAPPARSSIIRDMRRPSAHYITRGRLRFRFAQVLVNALALLAIAGGLAAYFRAADTEQGDGFTEAMFLSQHSSFSTDSLDTNVTFAFRLRKRTTKAMIQITNQDKTFWMTASLARTCIADVFRTMAVLRVRSRRERLSPEPKWRLPLFAAYPSTVRYVNSSAPATAPPPPPENPAPGICLPVIVSFCHYHRVPYNFTMFPNFMGHFTQRDAQQELEVYDAVVDVRCYELAALFLCTVFVPKCGPQGQLVRPCRSLCFETKRRCGFFLEVFSLTLPEYLECDLFPDSPDADVCVGHHEVQQAELRAHKPRMIHCGEQRCMSQSHVCDGAVHCPWEQDERNCIRLSERQGDEGYGTLELYHPETKGWQPACVESGVREITPLAICNFLGYANSNSTVKLGSSDTALVSTNKRNHQLKKSTLLKELRNCPANELPPMELSCTNFVCGRGRGRSADRAAPRIVGGVEATPGDWPFLAALLGGPEEVFYCAGVLIADQWVLTASHCVGK
ncbi:Frizzled [Gryllus bimaculatus]|nr:Frizzled [Gryllus bimaculatus]